MDKPIKTWINGAEVDCLSPLDRGFQYGDGVFETLAVVGGKPLLWPRHLKRLLAGCRTLRFETLPDVNALEADMARICVGIEKGVLKCVVTRGAGGRGYGGRPAKTTTVLTLWPWSHRAVPAGVNVWLCNMRLSRNPVLAGIKHLNRLEQVLARREWKDEFAEGIMLDEAGLVIE